MRRTTVVVIVLLICLLPASAQDDRALLREKTSARIDRLISEAHGIVGYAAIDLVTGELLGQNQDLVFPQASAIKIPILIEVFRQAEAAELSLTEQLPVRAAEKVGGSGVAQYFADSASALSLGDLCVLMIVLSDNTATNIIIERVGIERVNAMLRSHGFRATSLRRVMMDEAASAHDRENTSTPLEAARIMALLQKGEFVSPELNEQILQLLSVGKGGSFAGVFPDSVQVAWKPGGIAGVQTVWALVRLPERPYTFAVMEKFDSSGEAGELQRTIARILFDYFWRLGNASRYGTFVDPALRAGDTE